jgi:hypothetical protein
MGDAFGVQHRELAAGVGELGKLPGQAAALLARVRPALAGAAGAAGSDDLAKALMELDVLNARRMAELDALYAHIGTSLGDAASGYHTSDAGAADRIQASGKKAS